MGTSDKTILNLCPYFYEFCPKEILLAYLKKFELILTGF